MDRHDVFNLATAAIFEKLYFAHPLPVDLFESEIERAASLSREEANGVVGHTINWLSTNGYLTNLGLTESRKIAPNIRETGHTCLLTDKALSALNRVPAALGPTLAEKLKEALKSAGKETGRSAVGAVIGEIIGGIFKGVLNG